MNIKELERQFKEECTVINLDAEYPGNPGPVKWVIITSFSREELESRFSAVLESYSPYEISPIDTKDVIAEFNRNEDKFRKRQSRNTSIYGLDETVDAWCPAVPSFVDEEERAEMEENEKRLMAQLVHDALSTLTTTQRRRLLRHHVDGLTVCQIAMEEGLKDHTSIVKSISSGEKRFRRFFEKTPHFGTPLSKYSEGVISMSGLIASSTSDE